MSLIKPENLNENELSVITEEYPYYPIARFRLLSEFKKNKNNEFEKQALITALFFNNTRWLNRQLYYETEVEISHTETLQINDSFPFQHEETNSSSNESVPEQTLENNLQAIENTNEVLGVFEPLHTVDYFASQGIKVSEEPVNNDKLSSQLKSFTEWLKSMKKLHTQLPESDEQTDKIIQHIAESSNTNTNVVTEAMAEVLVKQGKIEHAIEMYEKLSLNYPAKSAYFAAKIKSLKSV
jgi:hypothetical protein